MTIKVGLAGFGLAGAILHSPLLRAAGFDVAAIATSREEEARRTWPGAQVVAGFDALLATPAGPPLDLIVIATPNHLHFSQAEAALKAGKAVVLDKPMALTYAECAALCDLAEHEKTLLTVFHNRRWDSDFLTMATALGDGGLGRPARFSNCWRRHRAAVRDRWREQPGPGAGALYDLGPHLIDQTLALFGPPRWVSADLSALRDGQPPQVDDGFELLLGYDHMRAHLSSCPLAAGPERDMRVDASAGSLVIDGLDRQEARLRAGMPADARAFGDPQGAIRACRYAPDGGARPLTPQQGAWHSFYQGVMASVRDGAPPPVPPREAAQVVRVIEAARDSAQTGRRVAL